MEKNSKKNQIGANSKNDNQKKPVATDVNIYVEEHHQPIHHGANVRHYRRARGWSQDFVAAKVGMPQQRYSELEKEEYIKDEDLQKIADLLGLKIDWLRDIPAVKADTIYNQGGSGIYFSNIGDAVHTINKPIEEVVESYKITLEETKVAKDEVITCLKQQITELKEDFATERNYNKDLLERLGDLTMKHLRTDSE